MSIDAGPAAEPSDLAERLLGSRDEIVRLFQERTREALPAARRLDDRALADHVPRLLERLAHRLRAPLVTEEDARADRALFRHHGGQRARPTGYSVEQLLAEHRILRRTIFEALERSAPVSPRDRDVILDFVQIGAKHAVSQFFHVAVVEAPLLDWAPSNRLVRIGLSLALVAIATLIQWGLGSVFEGAYFIAYFPAVVAGALVADGILVAVVSAVVAQYLFVPPVGEFHMTWPGDYARLAMFLFNGLLIAVVTRRLRKAQARANTAAREQEQAKREAEETARKLADEQELRGQFVATLTHDLRSPLSTIRLSAERLGRQPGNVEQLQRRIVSGAERVDQMIQNLLDVGRIRSGEELPLILGSYDLAGVVREVVEELQLQHGPRFVVSGPASIPGHWSGPDLRRVVENLCANALKYGSRTEPVTLTLEQQPPWVRLHVRNALAAGQPLTSEELAATFEPFHRARAAQDSGVKGWGLGLTLVKGIAEAHGGTVTARSAHDEGTTFTVTLPLDARTRPGLAH